MRDSASQNWRSWRITANPKGSVLPRAPLADRLRPPPELPGADGIRWGLVHRVRAEIAAGAYDTDEKLALAEERLLARYA